jgi:hypothetical protein
MTDLSSSAEADDPVFTDIAFRPQDSVYWVPRFRGA